MDFLEQLGLSFVKGVKVTTPEELKARVPGPKPTTYETGHGFYQQKEEDSKTTKPSEDPKDLLTLLNGIDAYASTQDNVEALTEPKIDDDGDLIYKFADWDEPKVVDASVVSLTDATPSQLAHRYNTMSQEEQLEFHSQLPPHHRFKSGLIAAGLGDGVNLTVAVKEDPSRFITIDSTSQGFRLWIHNMWRTFPGLNETLRI